MIDHEPGTRVFAVQSADEKQVRLYGKGVYVGDDFPPGTPAQPSPEEFLKIQDMILEFDQTDPISILIEDLRKKGLNKEDLDALEAQHKAQNEVEMARPLQDRVQEYYEHAMKNPKIELDDGSVVWGFQCWWGPEEQYEEMVAGREVVQVQVPV